MKINKKTKYILSVIGLAGLVGIPTAIALISCSSKPQQDKIIYDTKAEGARFNGVEWTKEQSPFSCDFNLTNKTCTINQWTTGEPNFFTEGLPDREGLVGEMDKTNNTVKIPSEILYNGEYYKVVAFSSFKGAASNKILSFNNIGTGFTQVLEFDVNLTELSAENTNEEFVEIINDVNFRTELLKVLNYTAVGFDFSYSKKLEVLTCNQEYNSFLPPYVIGCSKLRKLDIPNSVTDIGMEQFKDCTSLESITIPNTVTKIFNDAFKNCTSLKSLTIPDSVKEFGSIMYQTQHPPGFKIYFHSQETMDLFISSNRSQEQYCELLPSNN